MLEYPFICSTNNLDVNKKKWIYDYYKIRKLIMISKESVKLSIIVPIYNEEKTILTVLEQLYDFKKQNQNIQIIVINDGSKDNSLEILEKNKVLFDTLISYQTNKGKGNAVRQGLESANGEYIIFQDADLEYDPNDFKKFLNLIDKFSPDLIIGSRFNYADYSRSHYFFNKIGNKFITLLFNLTYNTTFYRYLLLLCML